MHILSRATLIPLMALAWSAYSQDTLLYTTCTSFDQVLQGRDARYVTLTRVSDLGTREHYQYLFLFHRRTKQFVPLAKLKSTADWSVGDGMCRVDLHPRFSRDGRIVSVDSTHEELGRQMYLLDIGFILDHPPARR